MPTPAAARGHSASIPCSCASICALAGPYPQLREIDQNCRVAQGWQAQMPNLHTWRMSANLVRPGSARLLTAPTDQEIKTAGRSDAPGFIATVNAIQRTDMQLQKLAIEVASPTP